MRQALTIALQGFEGAVVLVSHDRELIANVCDELFLVHDGQIDEFDGDISDYGKWLAEKRKQENTPDKGNSKKKSKKDNKKFVSRETNTSLASNQISNKAATAPAKAAQPALSKEEQRKLAAEQRKLTAPIRREIEDTEKALAKITDKLASLETKLADTELYEESRKADLLVLLNEQTALQQQHSDNEEKLLLAMTTLEEMEAAVK
jgi:ATP-binding cassette subfamily F protein 3